MFTFRQELGYAVLVAALSLPGAAQTNPATAKEHPHPAATAAAKVSQTSKVRTGLHRSKPSAAKPQPQPEPVVQQVAPTPPPPSRPFEMSPVASQVTYEGGQLTITAPNSTLADILSQVRAKTGTKVEFPSNASQERVALQLGPGSPRAVLTQLLQGSPFDYILLGSEQDPNAVTQIMLMRREGSGTAVASGNIPNQSPAQPEPADEDAENEPAPAQPPQPLARPTPGQMVPGQPPQIGQPAAMQQAPEQGAPGNATGTPTQAPGQATPPGQDNGPKTPEQLLQQLQQMQRQEQERRQRPPR